MPYTQVSNIDFLQIKTSLKEYMRAQSDFTDYDFEGSTLSVLLDTLAYNTYYTAFNTNMVVNELFIDSATLRDNVVALAKQLGYRPKSATSPTAYVSFTVTYTNPTTDTELILKKGTGFTATYDNNVYNYVVLDDVKAQVANGVATFTDVAINEGHNLSIPSLLTQQVSHKDLFLTIETLILIQLELRCILLVDHLMNHI